MKHICRIIVFTGMLQAFVACSSSQENSHGKTSATTPSYHERAEKVKVNGGAPEEYIALQKKAVEEMRNGKSKETSVNILSQMGYFYFRSGDYLQSLTYLQEAADSMFNLPPDQIEIRAGAKLLGNTSNLYSRMGMYDEALRLNTKAIELCEQGDNQHIPDLLRMRAVIFEETNRFDSAMLYLKKAIEASDNVEDKELAQICRQKNEKARAAFFIEHPKYSPDSITTAVKILEKTANSTPPNPTSRLLAGRGYVLLGNTDKGLKMMESAIQQFRKNYGTDDIEWALRGYSQSLLETELSPRSLEVYKESKLLTDTVAKYSKANALLGADFKYRTTRINNEKLLLENHLEMAHERTVWWSIITLITGCVTVTLAVMRIRYKNRIINNNKETIDSLIQERITLNSEIEILNSHLNKRICQNNIQNQENESAYSEILTMVLLTKEDESRFRKCFDSIYPGYIQRIRRNFSEISSTAELICMLIRLNKSNEEISLMLGIKRESVAKSRYRLRTLFKLDKDTDLNEFIAKL